MESKYSITETDNFCGGAKGGCAAQNREMYNSRGGVPEHVGGRGIDVGVDRR